MDILAPLFPYAVQILILGFVMILAGIAGGGKIEILNVTLGNLGIGARLVAGVLGLTLGITFLLIPRPFFDISGRVIPLPLHTLERDLRIELAPTRRDKKPLEDDGSFRFSHITSGEYTITLYTKAGEKLAEQERLINRGDSLLIRKHEDTAEFTIEVGDTVERLISQYTVTFKDWKDKVQSIEQLTSIAGKDKSARDRLIKDLQSEDKSLRELSNFVLAGLGERRTKKYLEEVLDGDKTRIYQRIRAASHLMYLFDHPGARDFLFDTVKDPSKDPGPRSSAALRLSEKATRKICVVEQLIEGLKRQDIRDIDVRRVVHQRLRMVTKQNLGENYDEWRKWLNTNRKQLEPC